MKTLKPIIESLLDDEDELSDPLSEIREFLDRIYICDKPFEIDASGDVVLVNTKGEVRISPKVATLSELTNGMFEFGETGSFVIWCNIKTLKGAPKHVHGSFNICSYELKSLEGGPIKVDKSYLCSECISLENLKGTPKVVPGNFDCSYCTNLKTLLGAPQRVGGDFNCEGCKNLRNYLYAPKPRGKFIK